MDSHQLLQKYSTIIQEEVNVKNLVLMESDISVEILYIPIGSQISSKFGKDTGRIIAAAKAGNIKQEQEKLIVFQGDDHRELDARDYETRYDGLDETHQSAEGNIIVSLDTQLDDELIAEGVAREISRFLNQMRKTADFAIDARVSCWFLTESAYLQGILEQYREFLSDEALIASWEGKKLEGPDGKEEFENEGEKIVFFLKK